MSTYSLTTTSDYHIFSGNAAVGISETAFSNPGSQNVASGINYYFDSILNSGSFGGGFGMYLVMI